MASTSASSIQKSFKYDVFLSFRGEDTRKNFVDHLYHALNQKGIYTYKDDEEIKKGKRISDELIGSIENSKCFIIVFSKNYASSSWCLDELVKIMECQKTNEQAAYPVFYDVEPTEIRKQSGTVGEAFAKHVNAETAGKWRDALNEAASLAGRELKNTFDGHEAKFIQKIVEEISLELRFINSSVDGKLIGMETRVKHVIASLEIDIENVRMIGIKGMGGIGKTTLARAVFDKISFQFEGSSFVENVREFSKNSLLGLKSLQKQILSDVLQDPNIIVKGVCDLKKMLCGRKVLVVLDDVDDIDQLEALAGEPSWFKRGSRVIITTRDEQVLVTHQVNLILDANLLSYKEAISLFIRYAFGSDIPNQSYKELSEQVVRYAAGLPLTIKVLGSFLCGKGEPEWKDALERLKTIPLKQTLEVLELSYNSLEEDFKEIFLDVACILKGWEKQEAIIALESCNYHARIGLRVLEQRSLITLSDMGCLGMHDHIEEMGQNLVRRLHPNRPYKHSRLWITKEIRDIFVKDKGTEATRCIKVRNVSPINVMKGLRKMKKLRFLYVACYDVNLDYNDVDENSLYLPNGLQYLYWSGYPFTCLPRNFHAKNLVGLNMNFSNIDQLWEAGERKDLKKLKFIDLTYCKSRSFDIRLFQNLERLKLQSCENLTELHTLVESRNFKHLSIEYCKLKTLNLTWALNLEELYLIKCKDLEQLQVPVEKFNLKSLHIRYSKLRTLDLTWAENLKELTVEDCADMKEVRVPAECTNLKHLSLRGSYNLKTLNLTGALNLKKLRLINCMGLEQLQMPAKMLNLKSVHISSYTKMRTLDLRWAENLKELEVEDCEDLEVHIPAECPNLKHLSLRRSYKLKTINFTKALNLEELNLIECKDLEHLHMPVEKFNLKSLEICYSKLRTLDLRWAENLENLYVEVCEDLEELHMPAESLKLKSIEICCSKVRTLDLGQSPHLERLVLKECYYLVEIHAPVGCLKMLAHIYLSGCVRFENFVVNEWSPSLPKSSLVSRSILSMVNQQFLEIDSLPELRLVSRSLDICSLHPNNNLPKFRFECYYKELLPSSTGNLEKLISSSLCACTNLASFSKSICGLQRLRKLTIEGNIPDVPNEIDQLKCLEELELSSIYIKHLPDSICMLKHLKFLRLESCWLLEQLPEDLGRLECLEELYLTWCKFLRDIPKSICEMKCLRKLHLPFCFLVEKLPEEIGRLKCLKELNIEGTCISHIPQSIFELKGLLIIGSRWRLVSYGFTSLLERTRYTSSYYV